jgi:hypothetical protein
MYYMSYHPRIESRTEASFITTRSRNSELWFINNPELERAILGYVAKFSGRYGVDLYALAIEGNHEHLAALFPKANRADFMRDLNSCIARAVPRHTPEYPGSKFWGRRYSSEIVPSAEDIKEQFFYTVLQQVQDGLAQKISQCPGYNCFNDAVRGIKRKFTVINWAEYNAAKKKNPRVRIRDFTEIVILQYARLPGYEHLSQKEYAKLMHKELEERRVKIVKERIKAGKGFADPESLKRTPRGSRPKHTKTSDITSHRPRVLSRSPELREKRKAIYFSDIAEYKEASRRYRAGEFDVPFPPGTYRPYIRNHAPP